MIAKLEDMEEEQIVELDFDTKIGLESERTIVGVLTRSMANVCGLSDCEDTKNELVNANILRYNAKTSYDSDSIADYHWGYVHPNKGKLVRFRLILGPYLQYPVDMKTAGKLEYRLAELLHNAYKNSTPGQPVEVEINYDLCKGEFNFKISNYGELPEDIHNKITQSFEDIKIAYEEHKDNGLSNEDLVEFVAAEARNRHKKEKTRRGFVEEKTRRTQTLSAEELSGNIQYLLKSQELVKSNYLPKVEEDELGGLGLSSILTPLLIEGGSLQLDPEEVQGRVSFTMTVPYVAPLPEFEPLPVTDVYDAIPIDPVFQTSKIPIQNRYDVA